MSVASITVVDGKLRERLQRAGRKMIPHARAALKKAGQGAERAVVRGSFRGYSGNKGRGNSKLQNRSGTLRRSVRYKVSGNSLSNLEAKVGASAPYARAHEYGRGPTYSKSGKKYYPIPTRHALTSAGVLRKPITEYKTTTKVRFNKTRTKAKAKTTHFGFLRIKRSLLFVKFMSRGKFLVLFNLFRFPTKPIPPRLGIRKAVDAQRPRLLAMLVNGAREALTK